MQEKLGVWIKKGDEKGKHKNQGTTKSNGPKDKNGYYLCGICGKPHKGICCKLKDVTQQPSKQGGDTPKNRMSKPATKNYIK